MPRSSSSDDGERLPLRLADGLAGCVAFRLSGLADGAALPLAGFLWGNTDARLAAFSFKAAMLAGEVNTVLCIGLRPRFDGF